MSSILKVDTIQTTAGAAPTTKDLGFAGGSVIQTVQFTANEQNIGGGSGTTIINSTFNPKVSGSKFAVWLFIPNCTASSGGSVTAKVNLGTNSSPNSNTEVISVFERMEGTGADDVRGINGHDFGSFTCAGTGTHYASVVLTPDNNTVVARHSQVAKLFIQEISQ